MMNNKKGSLSWDDFIKLGNPENAPDLPQETVIDENMTPKNQLKFRIHLEKKGRGGKDTTIIKGWDGFPKELEKLGKELKIKCGVGGSVKNNEIIIQGNQRDKVLKMLMHMGYTQTKKAGG